MKTLGKFSLFTATLMLLIVPGCTNKKPRPDRIQEPPAAAENDAEDEENGNLEARCFDGDPAACDELGH